MSMKESQLTEWVDARVAKCNTVKLAIVGGMRQQSGWPDRYYCHRLFKGFVEYKIDARIVQPHQQKKIMDLLGRGEYAMVARYKNLQSRLRLEHPMGKLILEIDIPKLHRLAWGLAGVELIKAFAKSGKILVREALESHDRVEALHARSAIDK